ncbi:TetR/AcrR family transcriptional regulator [Actinomyces vulturis]|uniref:TetR/AcrR family transcriptional regulator n=1 Tax=Actinomyces vulturis TaxID=1857645 RepID=UPI0008346C5B|nr:TetR/AcrR family transcriptional regulator [Actinomyces vulturis]
MGHPQTATGNVARRISARHSNIRRLAESNPSQRRAETQQRLLEAGRTLFASKGIGATSVKDICSEAGFTRGAFYSNFDDMDHFVRRVADHEWTTITNFLDTSLANVIASLDEESDYLSNDDAELSAAITRLSAKLLHAIPVSRDFYLLQNEFALFLSRDPENSPTLRAGYYEFRQHMEKYLVTGLSAIDREPLIPPKDLVELIFAASDRSMRDALGKGSENLTAMLERVLPTMLARMTRAVSH